MLAAAFGAAAGVFIGLILLGAALAKVMHWTAFRSVVSSYRVLPEALVIPFAWLLPPLEGATGAAVLLHVAFPWAPWIAASLLVLFAIAMAVNLFRGRTNIDCGCFQSALRQPLEWRLVARNLGLAALAVWLAAESAHVEWTRDVAVAALPAGIVFYGLYLALNTVWALDDSSRAAFPRLRS